MKLRSVFISLLAFLVAMLSSVIEDVTEFNLKMHLDGDCVSVANYISNHVKLFADKYNDSGISEETFKATSVETKLEITVEDNGSTQKGIFLDFNDDNGYMIIVDDYTFCDLEINGDSPFKGINSPEYRYSTLAGYIFLENDEYVYVDDLEIEDEIESSNKTYGAGATDEKYLNTLRNMYSYGAVYGDKCAAIFDINLYINKKYNNVISCDLVSSKTLIPNLKKEHYFYTIQRNLSVYCDHCMNGEGNCWFVSSYNLLQLIADAGDQSAMGTLKMNSDSRMPRKDEFSYYDPRIGESSYFYKYFDSNGNNLSTNKNIYLSTTSLSTGYYFPVLYQEVRKFAVNYFNGNIITDGKNMNTTGEIINYVGLQYDYDIYVSSHSGKSSIKDFCINSIALGYPIIYGTDDVGTETGYDDNHDFVAYGYKEYKITQKVLIFKTKKTKYFLEVLDGNACYINASTGTIFPIYFNLSDYSKKGEVLLINEYNKIFNPDGVSFK